MKLPVLEGAEGDSLLPLIAGEDDGSEPAYAETFFPRIHYGWSELRSLRQGDYKLILAPRPELYDLSSDPGETRNLYEQQPETADKLRRILGEAPELAATGVDAETRSRLESLGYVGGGAAQPSFADPKDRVELYQALNDPALKSVTPADGTAFRAAMARLDQALITEPTIPRAYVLYGELLLKAGLAREAVRLFERLVSFDSGFEGFYGLGMARQALGELDRAEAAYRAAHEVEPKNTKSHFRLSDVEAARGNVDAAEAWLTQGIEIAPNRVLRQKLAVLLLDAGRSGDAQAIFDELASEAGEDPLALYNLAQSLLMDGNAERALDLYRRAAELRPDDADIQQGIGNALLSTGELAPAAEAFERAIAIAPCFAGAHANLGLTRAQLGQLDKAVASMKKAISCDPSYILGYKNLAAVQLETGDVSGAIETLRRAPDDPEIERHLQELVAFQNQNR